MPPALNGIHHITAICGEPRRNVGFYVEALGQRLVKKTVNFDDPSTYHLYYGDAHGTPGTILTFFAWPHARPSKRSMGETAAFAYSAPRHAQDFWETRLANYGARQAEPEIRWGETVLPFQDPDGIWFELVLNDELFPGWYTPESESVHPARDIDPEQVLGAFHSATLWVADVRPTVEFLEKVFEWEVAGVEKGRTRLMAPGGTWARTLDVVAVPGAGQGHLGAGTIHHIAFRAVDDEEQEVWRSRVLKAGIPVTNVRDRHYFQSVYFREPGGVLFEIATDGPGFAIDEDASLLGEKLMLPPWLEPRRAEIEARLPVLDRA